MASSSSSLASSISKLGLLAAIAALAFALVPTFQREKLSEGEQIVSELKSSFKEVERELLNDGEFRLDFEGQAKWHSLALIASAIAAVLGLISILGDTFIALAALIIGLAVGAWQYFGYWG